MILLADSVNFSNAVKFWSNFETLIDDTGNTNKHSSSFFKFKTLQSTDHQECLSSSLGTCSSDTQTNKRNPLTTFLNNARRGIVSPENCCARCYNCMSTAGALQSCSNVPRGGHSHHRHAETLAEAAAGAAASAAADVAPYGLPLHLWKIIFQAILTTINVACWLLPLRSKKITENKLGLSLANAFSGGVFLSLAFGHLIPESIHGFKDFPEEAPFMLVLSGYLLIFFVEKVAFDAHGVLHEMEAGGASHAGHNHSHNSSGSREVENGPSGGRGAVILLGALAVHSILEMMALGLADSFGDCALLTLSIALHQVRRCAHATYL